MVNRNNVMCFIINRLFFSVSDIDLFVRSNVPVTAPYLTISEVHVAITSANGNRVLTVSVRALDLLC